MDFNAIPLGSPEAFNVLVEIPNGSSNKYELDFESGLMRLDYVFRGGFHFPFNYGSVPKTKAEDGDPLDAIVLSSYPLPPNTLVTVRPLGILKLKDRGEQDNKLLTVALGDPLAETLHELQDLTEKEQGDIVTFFKEVGVQKQKTMDIEGFFNRAVAMEEIIKYRIR